MRFVGDPLICLPIVAAIIIGGLGFPVLFELRRELAHAAKRWSLHTKITAGMTAILLTGGWLAIGLAEWTNPRHPGPARRRRQAAGRPRPPR